MCLENEKKSRKKEIIGYAVVKSIGRKNWFRSICHFEGRDEVYKKGDCYEALPRDPCNPKYKGFHGFYTFEAAKRYYTNGIVVKCKFESIIAEGTQEGLEAFRAKYRTILEIANFRSCRLKE